MKQRGQSVVEFAFFGPIILLLMLVALDFGRVYLGWINLQQMARVAANYAADHSSGWPGDPAVQLRYEQMVKNEASLTNCTLPGGDVPAPAFEEDAHPRSTGSDVTVTLGCEFNLLTPLLGDLLGNPILATASATFPVKEGIVVTGGSGGGSGGTTQPPVADFVGAPRSGWGPLHVTFFDLSTGLVGSWNWDFATSIGGSGSGSVSLGSSTEQSPPPVTYSCTGNPGDSCTFGVRLRVANTAGLDTETKDAYITVTVPPDDGPLFDFTADPQSGIKPLTVTFQFEDRGGTTPVSWAWDFGDGGSSTAQNPTHTYADEGDYTVTLAVSDGTVTNTLVKGGLVYVDGPVCTVPVFANVRKNSANTLWVDAGFTGTLTTQPGNGNYLIQYQSLVGGTENPQPNGCASSITVGPKP